MAQASFNALKTLPAAMGQLPRLELMRVAVNCIEQVITPAVLLWHIYSQAKRQAKIQH